MTDEQIAEIRARLEAAESSHISAPSFDGRHLYSPRQAREDISALLADNDRLRGELDAMARLYLQTPGSRP